MVTSEARDIEIENTPLGLRRVVLNTSRAGSSVHNGGGSFDPGPTALP